MEIRKISVGPDYKSGAMHYIVGQTVLGGNHTIELIKLDEDSQSIKIYIREGDVILKWKEFNNTVPVSLEYNINI
tara:strand:- start:4737 stop:4961 length:225 start_codon:yes stop_codon:yes gene_type:complete